MGAVGSVADNALAESFNATPNARPSRMQPAGPTSSPAGAKCFGGSCATTPAADTPGAATCPHPPTKPAGPLRCNPPPKHRPSPRSAGKAHTSYFLAVRARLLRLLGRTSRWDDHMPESAQAKGGLRQMVERAEEYAGQARLRLDQQSRQHWTEFSSIIAGANGLLMAVLIGRIVLLGTPTLVTCAATLIAVASGASMCWRTCRFS
jgi:hypothetical protein